MEITTFTETCVNQPYLIHIKTLTGRLLDLMVTSSTTILNVKEMLQKTEGYRIDQQRFIYSGKELKENATIQSYFIQKKDIIYLELRLRGGMFHETSSRKDMEPLQCVLLEEIKRLEQLLSIR